MEEMPPVIVDLFDYDKSKLGDKIGGTSDFLARALINLNKLEYSSDSTIPRPTWHKLYYKKGGEVSGEVLLSFAVVQEDFKFNKTIERLRLENEVEFKEFNIQMQILGLRGL